MKAATVPTRNAEWKVRDVPSYLATSEQLS